jgi:hypothetical protein
LEILFEFLDDFLHCFGQGFMRNGAFLAGLGDAAQKLVPVERLTASVALYDAKIGAFNFFVSGKTVRAQNTLASSSDAAAILG